MNKASIAQFFTARASLYLVAAFMLAGAAQLFAQNNPIATVQEVDRIKAPGESYNVGDTIDIEVAISGITGILSVDGAPLLQLDHKQTGLNDKIAKSYATYVEFDGVCLYFRYTVQPGDFAKNLNAIKFERNGAIITTSEGTFTRTDAGTLPTGTYGLADRSDIDIRTIGFVGQSDPMQATVTMQEGNAASLTVTRTQSSGQKVPFVVTADPPTAMPGNITVSPSPFTIGAGATDGTLTINGIAATSGPITLRLHPEEYGAGVTDGDLLVTVEVTAAPPAAMSYFMVESAKSDVEEGETAMISVQLTAPAPAGGLIVTLTNSPTAAIVWGGGSGMLVIPEGQISASKPAEFQAGYTSVFIGGSSMSPYFAMAAGTVVNISSYTPTFRVESTGVALYEGDPVATAEIILSRQATSAFTITLANDNPTALTIVGPTVIQFQVGDITRTYQVRALDGGDTVPLDSTATISGTCSDPSYVSGGSAVFVVENKNPFFTAPVPTIAGEVQPEWTLADGSEGFTYTFSWAGDDVAADRPKLEAMVIFGDGDNSGWIVGANGTTGHIYATPGNYAITIMLRDTDGGTASISGSLEILPAVRLLIHEVRHGTPNQHLGLEGRGWGTIDDTDAATIRTPVKGDYDWEIKYAPSQTGVTLAATPVRGIIGTNEFDSFFHVWVGDTLASAAAGVPVASETAMIRLNNESQEVKGVFSREFYDSDGCGDIDHDELPDLWEVLYGLDCESPSGDNGRMGNPDADFLPRGAGANLVYPAGKNNYTPDGIAFGNVFEVRGFHSGLNADTNNLPLGFPDGDRDEPRYGTYGGPPLYEFTENDTRTFYGTDPTNPDTDGDGRDDGWEYYFWYNAKFRGITGERYDPSQVIVGTIISSEEIIASFDPLHPGSEDDDTDGDGLSDIEEYVLGTNPIHWDTDGDGMNDGWEVANGLDPFNAKDATANPDGDWMARSGDLRHWEVYSAFGFDPRTAWFKLYTEKDRARVFNAPNTVPFTNYEEHYLGRASIDAGFTAAVPPDGDRWMTNPQSADSDGDGMPDGWELYVAVGPMGTTPVIWPIGEDSELDAAEDIDDDGLTALEEFHAIETCAPYGFANVNERWWNKFWATDPHNPDTDGDFVLDGDERTVFQYDNGYEGYIRGSRPGGMLNPCSVDTDMDYLPDGWEFQFAGNTTATGVENGMDGTYFDSKSGPDAITGEYRNFDYDGDGLENYQEYWANAVTHFHYDKWVAGLGYGAYDPAMHFVGYPYHWDWATWANYWQGDEIPDVLYTFMVPEFRPFSPWGPFCYASTDPRDPDSDGDGMDDYYEMFHGLNPLLSLMVDLVGILPDVVSPPAASYDFRVHPWLAGVETADPDMDGIPNWEEALIPNRPAPANYHTDPSPLWFTDTSYANSFVNLYYNLGSVPMYWGAPEEEGGTFPYPENMLFSRPHYMYSFEVNEGYDTDNDNIMDKQEILGTTVAGVTDPLDMESPLQRKALYLNGNAAARTRIGFAHGHNSLRSWTLEVWVRPETPASGLRQVILERPVWVHESDTMPGEGYVRRTFRLGIEWDGSPFVEYDNSGKSGQTEIARGSDWPLEANKWTHLAATMSGVDKKLRLFVNGQLVSAVNTVIIPATGVIDGTMADNSFTFIYSGAPIVIGAADAAPFGAVNGGYTYINGGVYSGPSQPSLRSYFKGWVDEVRIWDGARVQSEIVADLDAKKRYMRSDVIASREESVARFNEVLASRGFVMLPFGRTFDEFYDDAADALMRTGGETAQTRLPPTLLYHYSFDNLPDPNFESTVPASFASLNGRPTVDYPGIPWWHQAADRSTVYRTYDANPYLFVHWIENTVATLPIGRLDSNGLFRAEEALDSRYWQRFSTAGEPLPDGYENVFNNTANPYGMVYRHGDSLDSQIDIEEISAHFDPMMDGQFNHLLPLRGAVADKSVPLWDSAGTPGYDDNIDTDGDGMPDWWEIAHGLDPFDPSDADLDPDGDGLTNYWEYRLGSDPHNVYSFDPDRKLTDGDWDSDGDGLTNLEEINIYRTDPDNPDTDDDGISDYDEVNVNVVKPDGRRITSPRHSCSPHIERSMVLDGKAYEIPEEGYIDFESSGREYRQQRFSLTDWTVETWVKLDVPDQNGTLIERLTDAGMATFGVSISNGIAVAYYQSVGNGTKRLTAKYALPPQEWVHIAATLDTAKHTLALYLNGFHHLSVETYLLPAQGLGQTHIGQGLTGWIDNLRIWDRAMDADLISANHTLFSAEIGSANSGNAYRAPELAGVQFLPTDFAKQVLSSSAGAAPEGNLYTDISTVLGTPDHEFYSMGVGSLFPLPAPYASINMPNLGTEGYVFKNQEADGSWIKLDMGADVKLRANGDSRPELFVFERLSQNEAVAVAVSADGDSWYFVGFTSGGVSGIDLDAALFTPIVLNRNNNGQVDPGYAGFSTSENDRSTDETLRRSQFRYVWIIALASSVNLEQDEGFFSTMSAPGPDIDAVGVATYEFDKPVAWYPFNDGSNDSVTNLIDGLVTGYGAEDYINQMNWEWSIRGVTFSSEHAPVFGIIDSDGDGMPDWWEDLHFGDQSQRARTETIEYTLNAGDGTGDTVTYVTTYIGDADEDGFDNVYEFWADTNPNFPYSSEDGISDIERDSDGDGLSNIAEQRLGSHPGLIDTDDDGILDGVDSDPADSLNPVIDRVLSLSDGHVEMPRQTRFALTDWTVQAWVNPSAANANGRVVARQVAAGVFNYSLELVNGVPCIRFTHYEPITDIVAQAPTALAANTWAHLAGSFDRDSGRLSLFVNGVNVASVVTTRQSAFSGVGPVHTRVGEGFSGFIDEVAIFSAELDESDLTQLMYGVSYFASDYPLVSYYRFDDGTSAVGPDSDGRHYGTSGRADWFTGQVEEFALGFDRDWLNSWQNGGTLFGDVAIIDASAAGIESPVDFESGELYTDYDYTEDWWERLYSSIYASTSLYDSHLDRDGDGWDNWSEARYSAKSGKESSPASAASAPAADTTFTFHYYGPNRDGPLTVLAYSSQAMNGEPDATFVFGRPAPDVTVAATNEATLGRLRQGPNWLFAFIDRNSNGIWDEGEAAGLSERFPYDVGWDKNEISFTLTDRPINGFLRLSWPADQSKLGYIVSLQRITYALVGDTNTTVYTTIYAKSIAAPRNWLHEGDILDTGAYHAQAPLGYGPGPGLDWGGIITGATPIPIGYVSTYRLVVDGAVVEPLQQIHYIADGAVLKTPELVAPVGGAVQIRPRPVFSWIMPFEASSFELQIAPMGSMTPVYSSGLQVAPLPRNAEGLRVWSPPVHWGDLIPGGDLTANAYRWRVRVFQPRDPNVTQSAYTPYAPLQVDLSGSTEYGRISVTLDANYLPPAATIRVQAFETASFNDVPVAQKTIKGVSALPRTVVLEGLEKGIEHYVAAYVDQNSNNSRDIWESWGYYRTGAVKPGVWYYQPQPLLPAHAPQVPVANVKILHVDSDQDMIPDAYEYAMTGGLSSMGLALGGYSAMSAPGTLAWTDFDGDGVDDYREFLARTDATRKDTSGDGISDGQALQLGLAPTAVNELRISGIDGAAAEVTWQWQVVGTTESANVGYYGATSTSPEVPQTLNRAVTYVLERTDSLSNPQWVVVATINTDSTSGACDIADDMQKNNLPAAFYRIRALIE